MSVINKEYSVDGFQYRKKNQCLIRHKTGIWCFTINNCLVISLWGTAFNLHTLAVKHTSHYILICEKWSQDWGINKLRMKKRCTRGVKWTLTECQMQVKNCLGQLNNTEMLDLTWIKKEWLSDLHWCERFKSKTYSFRDSNVLWQILPSWDYLDKVFIYICGVS